MSLQLQGQRGKCGSFGSSAAADNGASSWECSSPVCRPPVSSIDSIIGPKGHPFELAPLGYSGLSLWACGIQVISLQGYIHLKCLKRWIMHRRDNRCEICNAVFNIAEERASLKQMIRTFCCGRCCGLIVKHLLFSASLMPLAHIILQQVSILMWHWIHGAFYQVHNLDHRCCSAWII